ncbi:hypothetical protein [Mycolicibacterium elephantis]|uniref:MFS transporter n=1 Tax=Mycolicibacterium elephantis DSM 44368 TaxID=1335622 RepID=A0A439DYZ5_9MYCO|nr:hypothetical protein [Mycolicibacterium elephantis]MCV7223273.1 hypothetical protein [Mycolicibacterium elephantis]RWA22916.1 hypothetical protein MELE44368_11900 [Mycolicibacterium elephantis DSM 44368]
MSPSRVAARIRGLSCGLLTAALAVAAHGTGGGTPPAGASAIQLAVLAATVGAAATAMPRAGDIRVLTGVLAVGQLLGHLMLAAGHAHTHGAAPPAWAMLVTHAIAVGAGAVLIATGERLWRAASRVVGTMVRVVRPPVAATTVTAVRRAEQPLRSALLLAASVSHRGPPVGALR